MQSRAVVYQSDLLRSPSKVPKDPLDFWISRLDTTTRPSSRSHFNRWLYWLWKQPGWTHVTPREVIIRQLEAEDKYELLDLLQNYIGQMKLRKSSKKKAYSTVKSFFSHNRCALPFDPAFKVIGDKPPVQAHLTVKDVLGIYQAAKLRDRSIIMVRWQSFVDNARLEYICRNCSGQIVKQIKEGVRPVRIDIPGRKSNKNDPEGSYYTFIGTDAVDALVKYFEDIRDWPKEGEPLWLKTDGSALTSTAFETMWMRLLRRIGIIPKRKGPVGSRYGYNPHETRDAATTLLHVKAKSEGFDMDCAKFWSGRLSSLDPEKYDKFFQDAEFIRSQYLIAEKYLNIVSGSSMGPQLQNADDMIEMIIKNKPAFEKLLDALENRVGARLAPVEKEKISP